MDVVHELSGLTISPEVGDDIATGEVFSNETGETYWVSAEAPLFSPDGAVGSVVQLIQRWGFRKDSPNASLRLTITDIRLQAIDHNGPLTPAQCPWGWDEPEPRISCGFVMYAHIVAQFWAERAATASSNYFFFTGGLVSLQGFGTDWTTGVDGDLMAGGPIFGEGDFTFDPGQSGLAPTLRLTSPITVEVPLDTIPVGTVFEVGAWATAQAGSRRQGESYVSAFLRDPARITGLSVASQGLTMLDPPSGTQEPAFVLPPAPPCGASQPPGAGGSIQFETTSFIRPEWPGDEAHIRVTRSGGSDGEASAAFAMGDGTASAGTDYEPVTSHVRFADGEEGSRVVFVPILADTIAEADETVSLTLSSPVAHWAA